MKDSAIIRILDANINRLREGLRVSEEVVRFYYDDKRITAEFKAIRHSLVTAISVLPVSYKDFLTSRNSVSDVGKDLVVHAQKRITEKDIFISNMKRAQEAVRVLEEFSKIEAKKASLQFQAIRFKLYTLEKKIFLKIF
jgi:thiamine-phosphate pyrophosphorylase